MKRTRWKARPVQSAALRFLAVAVPMVVSFGVGLGLSRVLPRPGGLGGAALWWAAIAGGSLAALYVVEKVLRRLGPLAVLLKLSMAFPDEAPSRFRVARRAGNVRELRERLDQYRRQGEGDQARVAETILALVAALSAHDRRTRGHSERVRVFTDMLATELSLPEDGRDRLRWAALLHDVGKLNVPERTLNKDGSLGGREWEMIRRHPREGMRFVDPLLPWLGQWAGAISQHHERYDGSGYPEGLRGTEICMGARIVSVADAYDAMTAARSYARPLSAAAARVEVAGHAGGQFDPLVVRALLSLSIGRLWWRVGIWAWIAQLPVIGRIPRAITKAPTVEEPVAVAFRTTAAVTGLALASAVPGAALSARDRTDDGRSRAAVVLPVGDAGTAGTGASEDSPLRRKARALTSDRAVEGSPQPSQEGPPDETSESSGSTGSGGGGSAGSQGGSGGGSSETAEPPASSDPSGDPMPEPDPSQSPSPNPSPSPDEDVEEGEEEGDG